MKPSTLNHLSCALMIRALLEGPSTVPEIAYECGLSYSTVRRYVSSLHRRQCIHIAAWDYDTRGRRTLRSYLLGEAPDARRPPAIRARERARRYRERARVLDQAMRATA